MKLGIHEGAKPYRALLTNALKTTWTHKELWAFGLFAALLNSGAIFSNVISAAVRLKPADQIATGIKAHLNDTLPSTLSWTVDFIRMNVGALSLRIILLLIGIVILLLIALIAQQLLLFGVWRSAKKKKHLPLRELFNELHHLHLLRLFAVNALVGLFLLLFLTALAFPLMQLLSSTNALYNLFLYMGFYAITLPVAFFANTVALFTMIHIVRLNEGLPRAFHTAVHTVSKHWLVLLELSAVVFLINLLMAATGVIGFGLIGVLYGVIAYASFALNTMVVYTALSFFVVTLTVVVAALMIGAITTFNYSVFMEVAERLERFGILPITERLRTALTRKRHS